MALLRIYYIAQTFKSKLTQERDEKILALQNNVIFKRVLKDIKEYKWTLLILAVVLILLQLIFGDVCPIKILLGIPCPGCGLTHGCIYVVTFRWKRAWESNPVSFLWVLTIMLIISYRYVFVRKSWLVQGAIIITGLVTITRYILVFFWYYKTMIHINLSMSILNILEIF